jgi:hypothetical protein
MMPTIFTGINSATEPARMNHRKSRLLSYLPESGRASIVWKRYQINSVGKNTCRRFNIPIGNVKAQIGGRINREMGNFTVIHRAAVLILENRI